uniref:Uncharacterized protein n=1 Tax=Oryza meridionalis TaxID=40149 RepID=A0A0E0EWE0_9ORYZ
MAACPPPPAAPALALHMQHPSSCPPRRSNGAAKLLATSRRLRGSQIQRNLTHGSYSGATTASEVKKELGKTNTLLPLMKIGGMFQEAIAMSAPVLSQSSQAPSEAALQVNRLICLSFKVLLDCLKCHSSKQISIALQISSQS